MANWDEYRKKYEDVETWINEARQPGIAPSQGVYAKKYGRDTGGWEQRWVDDANRRFKRTATDAGEFSPNELAQLHYEQWGTPEGRTWDAQAITEGQGSVAKDDYFDIGKFEGLLGRLEGSKGRQQRQKSLEGRRDTYAQGLSSMMGNF